MIVFDYDLRTVLTGMGAAKGETLEEFVRAKVPIRNIEDLKIPFAAVATDLNRGTRVVLDKGTRGPRGQGKLRDTRRVSSRSSIRAACWSTAACWTTFPRRWRGSGARTSSSLSTSA